MLVYLARIVLFDEPWIVSMILVKVLLLKVLVLVTVIFVRFKEALFVKLLLLVDLEIFASKHGF